CGAYGAAIGPQTHGTSLSKPMHPHIFPACKGSALQTAPLLYYKINKETISPPPNGIIEILHNKGRR
ncbi:MAG: hypothetical protein P4L67_00255, partial [Candidatus Pacebacteria bacterium]|nr:hypothetical protein [Candidatus Paceibacterota bacterium]